MFRFKGVKISILELQNLLAFLQEKYAKELAKIEQHYPIQWYIEKNSYRIWAPSTTLAFTHLGEQQLTVCFLLQNIEKEINSKHTITDDILLKDVTECFVEFLFLHELKHMHQFCEGLTLEYYKKFVSYKTNPFEEQANSYALKILKNEQEYKYDLLNFILNNGHINQYNETKWLQKRASKND